MLPFSDHRGNQFIPEQMTESPANMVTSKSRVKRCHEQFRKKRLARTAKSTVRLVIIIAVMSHHGFSQSNPQLQAFFRQNIGLTEDQIATIRNGQAVAKAVPSRTPDEIFLFGAVYIHASPEAYVRLAHDFDRLRKLPGYQALGVFSNPLQASDVKGFSFDSDDIKAVERCKPGECLIQAPATSIEEFHRSIDWSATDVNLEVNELLRKTALQFLLAYQREGNQVFGAFNDKHKPVDVAQQFAYMISYYKALPEHLPEFYRYLLSYPNERPANVEDTFYWARVKFGLKPTLRIVHVVTMRGNPTDDVAYAIAEKQLYSSHYFETALDMSFCIPESEDQKNPGFYLIMAMGSEQAGLTGLKGSIVREAAIGRSVSSLRNGLTAIRNTLENK
jgi:hypothetical protein